VQCIVRSRDRSFNYNHVQAEADFDDLLASRASCSLKIL
jgi:hypothetical protein